MSSCWRHQAQFVWCYRHRWLKYRPNKPANDIITLIHGINLLWKLQTDNRQHVKTISSAIHWCIQHIRGSMTTRHMSLLCQCHCNCQSTLCNMPEVLKDWNGTLKDLSKPWRPIMQHRSAIPSAQPGTSWSNETMDNRAVHHVMCDVPVYLPNY